MSYMVTASVNPGLSWFSMVLPSNRSWPWWPNLLLRPAKNGWITDHGRFGRHLVTVAIFRTLPTQQALCEVSEIHYARRTFRCPLVDVAIRVTKNLRSLCDLSTNIYDETGSLNARCITENIKT